MEEILKLTMTAKEKLIIVSELFHPEESATSYIMTAIASHFKDHYEVRVIAGPASYETEAGRMSGDGSVLEGINVTRVWAPRLNKNKIAQRILRQLIVAIGLAIAVFRQVEPGMLLLSVTNPAPMPVLLAITRRFVKFRCSLLVHDVFPENIVALGLIGDKLFWHQALKKIFNWAYESMDNIIVLGRDMSEVVSKKIIDPGKKIHIIENWSDGTIQVLPGHAQKLSDQELDRKIVFGYAGNIGRAQGILELIEIISDVQNKDICFVFAGGGALKEKLTELTKDIEYISNIPAYARFEQNVIFSDFDIGLVVLGDGMYGLGVPSKTYNMMAAGKPIFFIGPNNSEIYRLVKECALGWAFDWGERDTIMDVLNSFKLESRRDFYEFGENAKACSARFTEDIAMKKFHSLFVA